MTLPECRTCRPVAEAAYREGKAGYVMCPDCIAKSVQDNTDDGRIDAARSVAWNEALRLCSHDRMQAAALARTAEMTVVRRLVSAQLPGGEIEFWKLVAQELTS